MNTKKFCVIGGDLRQRHLVRCLERQGFVVEALLLNFSEEGPEIVPEETLRSAIASSDFIVLPLPVAVGELLHAPFSAQKLSVKECLRMIADCDPERTKILLGGKCDGATAQYATLYHLTIEDYFEREELAVLNAVPTAEGALEIALHELPTTIFGLKVLLTGFGRISKVLLRMLTALGAEVTVAVRKKSDLAWIKVMGGKGILLSQMKAGAQANQYKLVYNTVPAMIFDESTLSALDKDSLVIDLASKPGGVDFDMAVELGIKTIWALSLPGKVAPISSGEIIADTVLGILDEKGGL